MKTILLIISIAMMSYGLIFNLDSPAIGGAILYLLALGINFISLISLSRHSFGEKTKPETVSKWLEGVILIFGLIAMLCDNIHYKRVGEIIWFGTIGFYILSGLAIQLNTNLSLKMGYGGWYLHNKKRKK